MKRTGLFIAIAAILIAACQPATPTPTSTGVQLNASTPTFTPPPPPDTPAPVTTSTSTDAIDLQIAIQGQAPDPLSHLLIDAGASLTIRIDSVFVTYIEYVEQPSFLTSYEIRPSASSPVTEMQFCVSLEAPCELTGQWTLFYPHQEVVFPADWLGTRTLSISASFRDAGGNNVSYFNDEVTWEEPLKDSVQLTYSLDSLYNPLTPIAALPTQIQVDAAATQTAVISAAKTQEAFLAGNVTGSVVLNDGMCCTGGVAGSTVHIKATYDAKSPFGDVIEMRTSTGCPASLDGVPWEPFTREKMFDFGGIPINWVGFYVSVQYRDANGNVSPVYCDDISVEGMPPPPSP